VQAGADGSYISVRVHPREPTDSVVRQLAHEFVHVTEIAAEPGAIDRWKIRDLYERIGFRSCAGAADCYETRQAQEAEKRVDREVASSHASGITGAFFGSWNLDLERSAFESCPPSSGRRVDRDQKHGLASVVVEFVDCEGAPHRDAFANKADGRDYVITSHDARPSRTIAVTIVDKLELAFAIKEDGVVVACGRRAVNGEGTAMTVETWTMVNRDNQRRTLEFWRRAE